MRILTKQASMKLTLFLAIVMANILKHHSLSHATEGPRTLLWVGEGQFGQRKAASSEMGRLSFWRMLRIVLDQSQLFQKIWLDISHLSAVYAHEQLATLLHASLFAVESGFCWRWSLPRHDLSVSQSSGCRSLRRLADTFQQTIWIKHPKACNLSTVSTVAGYLRFSSLFFCVSSMMCTF